MPINFMPDNTITANVTVVNPHGIHLRPADLFARTASKFQAKVAVICDDQTVDGKSIVEMLMLAARAGSKISIRATGSDAQEVINALVELVQNGFGEMEESADSDK